MRLNSFGDELCLFFWFNFICCLWILFKNYYLNILRSPPRHTHFGKKGGRGGVGGRFLFRYQIQFVVFYFDCRLQKTNKQTKEPSEISGDWCQRCEMPSLFSFSVLLLSSWELFYYIEHSEPQQLRLSLSLSHTFSFTSHLNISYETSLISLHFFLPLSLFSVLFFSFFETFSFFFLEFSLSLP